VNHPFHINIIRINFVSLYITPNNYVFRHFLVIDNLNTIRKKSFILIHESVWNLSSIVFLTQMHAHNIPLIIGKVKVINPDSDIILIMDII